MGIENRIFLQHGWGRTKKSYGGSSGTGAPLLCSASLVSEWCGYIPMMVDDLTAA
jgi:hypothetical protein